MKRGKYFGIFLALLVIGFIGVVSAAQNPNYPIPGTGGGSDWYLGAPDGGSCKNEVEVDLTGQYPEILIGNICSDARLYPNFASLNKFCQLYTGEATSYATYGRVHSYHSCGGDCMRAKFASSWSCIPSYTSEINIQLVHCGKNCCTPKTCAQLGKNCGSVGNGCGGTLNCGTCDKGSQCTNNVCTCIPATCASLGKTCGTWDDGCKGTLNCGGTCLNVCTNTNAALGKPVTTNPTGTGSPSLITDGTIGAIWNSGRADDSSATINLNTVHNISKYSISCSGVNGGNTGIIYFQNSAGTEIGHSSYSCYGKTITESFATPLVGVNKIYILINGGGDWRHLGEVQVYEPGCPAEMSCDVTTGQCLKVAMNNSWSNMKDIAITKANINDTVKLVVKGDVANRTINYTLKKETELTWNPLSWFNRGTVAQTSGRGFALWKATEFGKFYFIAQILNEDGSVLKQVNSKDESNEMGILTIEGEGNSLPTIKIIKPARETTYIINETTGSTAPLSFEQISSDEDDDLNVTWDFGEDSSSTFSNCITTGNCNTTYTYNKSGTKMIRATAKEMLRSQSAIDISRVFIYKEGLNIFAIIDSPDYKTIIREIGNHLIDGRGSHVANCSFYLDKCTAGANLKPCDTITDSITSQKIYCYKFAESSDNRFGFKWTIENKVDIEHTNFRYFNKSFVIPKDYPINLRVNFTF
jgi:hypothetical protein